MPLWKIQRLECKTVGPILGFTTCQITMEDTTTPGSSKYEVRSFATEDLKSNPNLILETLNADGFTPNDFGLVVE